MGVLTGLSPERVFEYFELISAIAHGSGNMSGISQYCMAFASEHGLKAVRDRANNVIIYKDATAGYEQSEALILQGHLDMVCQKDEGYDIDFDKDGLSLYVDGDFVKAHGTTLGADNGIAVAMILAILSDSTLSHPPVEAVFTTDEEVGMLGALELDTSLLRGKRMINLDAEEPQTLTVSCAGGSDFSMIIPTEKSTSHGVKITLKLSGLLGGHSGVEIHKGRVNAATLAGRVLNHIRAICEFDIIRIDSGDKGNAIPLACMAELVTSYPEELSCALSSYLETVRSEILSREPGFAFSVEPGEEGTYPTIGKQTEDKLLLVLNCAPNGVMQMSAEIEGLVETSLNLGILKTSPDDITLLFALRSNKQSALRYLEEKLSILAKQISCEVKVGGHYPPWEFKENSKLQELYKETYHEQFGDEPIVVAIHAGLECGVFSSAIEGLDCIAIGPQMYDVHTTNERLSIQSTGQMFALLVRLLARLK